MSSEDSYLSDTPERHAFAQRMLDARDARLRDMAENGVERDEDAHELYVLEVNGKKYVGQTRQRYFRRNGVSQVNSSENRAVQHVDDALKEHGGNCTYLNNAIRKHGLDAIKLTVLFVNVPADDINDLEIRMIRELNTRKPHGYNLQEGGSKGRAHDDTRRKMSEQRQGELHPMYGKNHSVDTRLRLIQAGQKQGLDKDGVTLLPRGIRSVKQKKNYRMYEVTAYRVEEDEIKRYLVAYGAQDTYLTGNPQITFFKVVYRRCTNFSMESVEQTFNGSADFGKRVQAVVSRNGDLIHRTYLQVELPTVTVPVGTAFRWLNWVGHTLISQVDVEIGGQRIDRHYSTFLHIWSELTETAGHKLGYANMVGNVPQLTTPVENKSGSSVKTVPGQTLFIPLQFWFCRNAGLALPLIALQYHEVRINVEFAPVTDLYWAATWNSGSSTYTTNLSAVSVPALSYASLWIDYIYLDTDERRRFAQSSHEYLIEQLQYTGPENANQRNIKLNYNHPTKELIWVVQLAQNVTDSAPGGKQWYNFTDDYDFTYAWVDSTYSSSNLFYTPSGGLNLFDPQNAAGNDAGTMPGVAAGGANNVYLPVSFDGGANPVKLAKLQLNGHDRFQERPGRYFNLVQPYQHHENVPANGINVYSFALRPEEHQPSGSINFSRIDNTTLQLTLTDAASSKAGNVLIYAINYNVLRLMSGMGGLAYSN